MSGDAAQQSRLRFSRLAWTAIVAGVALASSAVALAFTLWPELKPDPRASLAANLKALAVERDVALRDYFRQIRRDASGLDVAELRTRGAVVYLQIGIEGRKHRDLVLRQHVYRAATRRRVPGEPDVADAFFRADTPNDRWVHPVFIPGPFRRYDVFVRLELYDGSVLLAFADTPAIPSQTR
jgi:hypothetical protein